jgi:hypothetical protein
MFSFQNTIKLLYATIYRLHLSDSQQLQVLVHIVHYPMFAKIKCYILWKWVTYIIIWLQRSDCVNLYVYIHSPTHGITHYVVTYLFIHSVWFLWEQALKNVLQLQIKLALMRTSTWLIFAWGKLTRYGTQWLSQSWPITVFFSFCFFHHLL